jgi:hypothetical protein
LREKKKNQNHQNQNPNPSTTMPHKRTPKRKRDPASRQHERAAAGAAATALAARVSALAPPRHAAYATYRPSLPARFAELPLTPGTHRGLEAAGFTRMTEIQRAVLPHALAGRDVLAAARTGSGKTLAFLVPVVEGLVRAEWGALVRGSRCFPLRGCCWLRPGLGCLLVATWVELLLVATWVWLLLPVAIWLWLLPCCDLALVAAPLLQPGFGRVESRWGCDSVSIPIGLAFFALPTRGACPLLCFVLVGALTCDVFLAVLVLLLFVVCVCGSGN